MEKASTLNFAGQQRDNQIGMVFLWVPPGSIRMGRWNLEFTQNAYTFPKQDIEFPQGFWLGRYPVTQAQWQAVTGQNPSLFTGAQRPVECVSYHDCQTFLEKLSALDGHQYRLPTEAEWEYACCANSDYIYHCGDSVTTDQANFNGSLPYPVGSSRGLCCDYDIMNKQKGENRAQTTEVGAFPPNAWGFYDMAGNVWEWCSSITSTSPVLRGGSWFSSGLDCRVVSRIHESANEARGYYGLRVLMIASGSFGEKDCEFMFGKAFPETK